jgi:hypothetical protein
MLPPWKIDVLRLQARHPSGHARLLLLARRVCSSPCPRQRWRRMPSALPIVSSLSVVSCPDATERYALGRRGTMLMGVNV